MVHQRANVQQFVVSRRLINILLPAGCEQFLQCHNSTDIEYHHNDSTSENQEKEQTINT